VGLEDAQQLRLQIERQLSELVEADRAAGESLPSSPSSNFASMAGPFCDSSCASAVAIETLDWPHDRQVAAELGRARIGRLAESSKNVLRSASMPMPLPTG